MKLIAREPVHGVEVGQAFEADGADACRLIIYGFANPAEPGPTARPFGTSTKRAKSKDALLAAELRSRCDARGTPAECEGQQPFLVLTGGKKADAE